MTCGKCKIDIFLRDFRDQFVLGGWFLSDAGNPLWVCIDCIKYFRMLAGVDYTSLTIQKLIERSKNEYE